MTFNQRRISPDLLCVLALIALWLLFFWRLITPNPANALSIREGDFSGQFVAWAGYQGARQHAGEVALWNPYSSGGHPFLADTQSGVFYPPRVVILALTWLDPNPTPGRVYMAMQVEVMLHTLIASLLMYAFVRRLTKDRVGSVWGAFVAALTFAYGGYLTGYPMLQVAVLESSVWLPLMLLGILEATRDRINYRWFGVSGVALGLAFHAGSPQFAHWSIILTLIFLAWRVYSSRRSFRVWLVGAMIFGGIGGGLAAVQLLPGLQYYALSARRSNFTFDQQGNGFPPFDVLQMIFPGWLTQWSPLFFGVSSLALAIYAVWRDTTARFWAILGGVALLISFGRNTVIWDVLYNLPLGFSLFRQQERAAYPVAICAAILAGLGTITLFERRELPATFVKILRVTLAVMIGVTLVFFVIWQIGGMDDGRLRLMTFSVIIAALTVAWFMWVRQGQSRWQPFALIALLTLELFTIGHGISNYQAGAASTRLPIPAQVQALQADPDPYFRVDGERGIRENYGALYGVQDIRGTSPLRLDRYDKLLTLPKERLWDVLAVRYVFTPDRELPAPSAITGTGTDPYGEFNIHRLNAPRPFARLVYRTWIEADDQAALNALARKDIDIRQTAILPAAPAIALPENAPADGAATITKFAPERVTIQTRSSTPAILDLSLVYYPGWQATVDGARAEILRSNLAMMAVALPAGEHTVQLTFAPEWYSIGGLMSLITLFLCVIGIGTMVIKRRGG
jgi:NADH:ubiquinone oxidoreductase subunit 3 (subunit A)